MSSGYVDIWRYLHVCLSPEKGEKKSYVCFKSVMCMSVCLRIQTWYGCRLNHMYVCINAMTICKNVMVYV